MKVKYQYKEIFYLMEPEGDREIFGLVGNLPFPAISSKEDVVIQGKRYEVAKREQAREWSEGLITIVSKYYVNLVEEEI